MFFEQWYINILCVVVCLIVLAAASIEDKRAMHIPNSISLPSIPAGLIVTAFACNIKEAGIRALVIVGLLVIYFTGLIAGGDIKLLMGLIAWNGALPMLCSFLIANLIMLAHIFIKNKEEGKAVVFLGINLLGRNDKLDVIKRREGKRIAFAPYLFAGYCITIIGYSVYSVFRGII